MRGLVLVAIPMVLLFGVCGASAQSPQPSPIFRFETDGFWLNLHHFLYVIGRAEAGLPDATRAAVKDAPSDVARALSRLSEAERRVWREAVNAYAAGPSRKNAVFDAPLPEVARALAGLADTSPVPRLPMDSALGAVLEQAAPIYRKAWWPEHRAANRRWQASMDSLLARHGAVILAYLRRAYGLPWPADGYPIQVSAYVNWAGAYSTRGNVLVVSSRDVGTRDFHGLETLFHEAMHQWDDTIDAVIRNRAAALGRSPPPNLSHTMIFFTAGEAIRQVAPDHVPYADAYGIWQRGWMPMRTALAEIWKPYLDGRGTRDQAISQLVERLSSR